MTSLKFACPDCGSYRSKVCDTRPWFKRETDEEGVWRRRECLDCHARFSTREHIVVDRPVSSTNPNM